MTKARVVGGATVSPDNKLVPYVADTGPAGKSAYQLWLSEGHSGTEAQYIASLRGQAANGWSPVLAGEADGVRTLIKVVDWAGGSGTKPDVGMYLGTTGYVTTKAEAFNFNASKRVIPMSAVTVANGIATINMTAANFANVPSIVPLTATTNLLSGPTRSTIVAGSLTKTSVQIKVEQQAILTGIISALVGATANVLVIEN